MAANISNSNLNLADKLDTLVEKLGDAAESIRKAGGASFDHKVTVTTAAQDILQTVQEPTEHLMGSMVMLVQFTATRLFVKWKVFETIPLQGLISYKELSEKVGADEALIRRFAWILVGTGILRQQGQDQVEHTDASRAFAVTSPLTALLSLGFDQHFRTLLIMPEYFDKYGLKEPQDRYGTIHAYSSGDPGLTVWEHLKQNPEKLQVFMTSMAALAATSPVICSYDMSWAASKADEDPNRALLVDVGGGKGHAVEHICKATPSLPPSRCVVEDLPEVVEAAQKGAEGILADVKFVPMDFHSEQPVKGALVYYIRRCLHDYGDDIAADMLKQIQEAMAPDSRLLIVEEILSNPPTAFGSAQDVIMATLGGKERTIEDWRALTGRAGLSLTGTHRTEGSGIAVIECVRM